MVGTVIRKTREDKNLSLSELARKARVGVSTLSEIESNKHTPRFQTLKRVVNALENS